MKRTADARIPSMRSNAEAAKSGARPDENICNGLPIAGGFCNEIKLAALELIRAIDCAGFCVANHP